MYSGQIKGFTKKQKIKPLPLKYYETGESIVWDGTNADEVARFCDNHSDLCSIHSISSDKTLIVEPADIMRYSCLQIPLGSTVCAYEKPTNRWVGVKKESVAQ